MSCRRAFEIDLAAFLHEPRDARWDEFRAHYPGCPECAAEVAAWTQLEALLAPPHPDEDTLLRWARDPAALDARARAAVERHLEGCASCRDELRTLERFAALRRGAAANDARPSELQAAAAAAVVAGGAAHEPHRHELGARPATRRVDHATRGATATSHAAARTRRGPLGVLRRVLLHPAVPWAALLVLLVLPTLRRQVDETSAPPQPKPLAVERRRIAAQDAAAPAADERAAGRDEAPRQKAAPQSAAAPPPQAEALADVERRVAARRADDAREAAAPAPAAGALARDAAPPPADAEVASLRAARKQRALDAAAGVRVEPAAGMRLTAPRADGRRTLVVELPEAARTAPSLEVRVRDASGARELRERLTPAPRASSLSVDLPAAWLDSARYAVEVVAPDGTVVARGAVTAP